MAIYFKPRRGKKATAISQNIILRSGEVFFEVPDTGVGTGKGKIKMGDGVTTYGNLPYFAEPSSVADMSGSAITFTENTSTNNTTLLNTIVTGAKLNIIIAAIKKLISNINSNNSATISNMRYNSSTDMIQIYYNGAWVNWKDAGLK